jgi:hypothetical protein
MRTRTFIRDVVAWTLVAIAVLVAIGATTSDSSQQAFVECIEATRQSYPTAKFDEINAYCFEELGLLD